MSISLFISHSSQDIELTQALISLLESTFYFDEREIRCTSLSPYKLPSGSHTSTKLRQELAEAELVLCVLTPVSTQSEWVRFELGAAWATEGKWVVPMLAGLDYDDVPGPLRELHVLKVSKSESVYQLLDEIRERLGWQTRSSARIDGAARNLVIEAEKYEENDFPLAYFDIVDFFDLEDLEINDPTALECIVLLMSNIDVIELVEGQTGRKCSRSLLKVFREAFLNPPVPCSLSAEKSDNAFEPDNINLWVGDMPWEIDNATHYQLTAKLDYSDGDIEHVFEFTVENEPDGRRGKYIADKQVRWSTFE